MSGQGRLKLGWHAHGGSVEIGKRSPGSEKVRAPQLRCWATRCPTVDAHCTTWLASWCLCKKARGIGQLSGAPAPFIPAPLLTAVAAKNCAAAKLCATWLPPPLPQVAATLKRMPGADAPLPPLCTPLIGGLLHGGTTVMALTPHGSHLGSMFASF